ncbi:TPA: hypothetical protein ACIE7L_004706, partial [Escherichia coli]
NIFQNNQIYKFENYYNGRVYKKSNFAGDCETAFALAVKFALAQLLQLLL